MQANVLRDTYEVERPPLVKPGLEKAQEERPAILLRIGRPLESPARRSARLRPEQLLRSAQKAGASKEKETQQ